ncbi:oxygenase MpaB family protein [Tsukamurella ocularis]|uniref:oxygenase MpaB family protein n=1 Tax=Tsukamurella ocularis TaxID=1970234 RepID=UPI0039EE5FC2
MRHYPELAERVRSQAILQPDLYGDVDVDAPPYRHTADPEVPSALHPRMGRRAATLDDERTVELIAVTTLLGDVVADPYASLEPRFGTRTLVEMLRRACREGIDAVPEAPAELRAFVAAMEDTPAWVDMGLVEEGARLARVGSALTSPFITRGVFLATFLNTYAALPMALTGALSGKRAARRINETANFFAVTTLPGALQRHREGFEAAAMVRLMHSMVRFHALTRPGAWNREVYGIPIPQVDQMPAGTIGSYLLAIRAVKEKRDFDAHERAIVEFNRYRCFLLGLPEELLPTTPKDIVRVFLGRAALLRDDFDDETCGALVRSSMEAYLRPERGPVDEVASMVEKAWSKTSFAIAFCDGRPSKAARMGVDFTPVDVGLVALTAPFIGGRTIAAEIGVRIPVVRHAVDRYLTRLIHQRLATYGHPEFVSDGADYARA